ncbi:MAG TPA: autotransporter outer membrane beta-barrel domain-containing protein, partial [Stellaceae bacterium]|nr:autotransporter outer membrane beta-barrel domain-containing protein [Stellaceae bacterium]
TLGGAVRVAPVAGSGAFASSQTFKDAIAAQGPISFGQVSATVPLFTARLAPDAADPNALDLTLALSPAGIAASAQDLTQSLRFGLEAPEVLRDSIQHRLVEGVTYDGGGIATANLSDPGHAIAGGGAVANDPRSPGGLWARGYGVLGSSSPFESRRAGLVAGGDWHLNDQVVIGLALDYDHTEARFADAAVTRLDAYQGAGYLGWAAGPWYASGLAGAGIDQFSTSRELAAMGLSGLATSHPGGATYEGYGEAGYHLKQAGFTLTPYLGAGYTHASLDAFTESGSFGALAVNAGNTNSLETTLGLRVTTRVNLGDSGTLVPELRLGWSHEFLDATQSLTGALATTSFQASGVNFGRDSAVVGVGVTQTVSPSARIFVDYDGKITGSFQQHALSAGLRVSF